MFEEARSSLDKYLREKLKAHKPNNATIIPHWRLDWLDENPQYKDADMFLKLEWVMDMNRPIDVNNCCSGPQYVYAKDFKIIILDEDHYKEMAYVCEKAGQNQQIGNYPGKPGN